MKCPNCRYEVEEGWEYCPSCGFRLGGNRFSDIFSRVEKEFEVMNRGFEKNFEVFDISPFFRKTPEGSGFTVRITQSSGNKPKIDIRTYGDVDRKGIEEELKRMGVSKPSPASGAGEKPGRKTRLHGVTEEPRTEVKRIGDRIVVDMEMPGVRDEKDIEISSLENSIEVRAVAGDKAYFKILTKPPDSGIIEKKFSKGTLHMEFG